VPSTCVRAAGDPTGDEAGELRRINRGRGGDLRRINPILVDKGQEENMMRVGISTVVATLGLALLAQAAEADSKNRHGRDALFTAPLVPADAGVLDCYLVNVSNKTRDVTIRILRRDGTEAGSQDFTLEPLTERVVTSPASEEPRYCQFVVEGSKSNYRGSALVREPITGTQSALPAV
jgi:hypothetical protein